MTFVERIFWIANKVRWFIWVLAILVLEIKYLEWKEKPEILFPILILGIYNLLAGYIISKIKLSKVYYSESILDISFITAIVYSTGGIQSPFVLFYFAPIAFSACYYKQSFSLSFTFGIVLIYILFFVGDPSKEWIPFIMKTLLFLGVWGFSSYIAQEVRFAERDVEYEARRVALLQAQMQERLNKIEKEKREFEEIYKISLQIDKTQTLTEGLSSILHSVSSYLKTDINLIAAMEGRRLKVVAGDDLIGGSEKTKEWMDEVILNGRLCAIENIEKDDRPPLTPYRKMGILSLVSLPLMIKSEKMGIFLVGCKKERVFSLEEQRFLRIIASISSLFIDNTRLSREIDRLLVTDKLTTLFNYYYFEEAVRREMERAKRINDTFYIAILKPDIVSPEPSLLQRLGIIVNFQTRKEDIVASKDSKFYILIHAFQDKDILSFIGRIKMEVLSQINLPIVVGVTKFHSSVIDYKELLYNAESSLKEAESSASRVFIK
ncbi:TPA: hypothetical protein DCX16_04715 [bacterium]|nr:hypothetical protein [bacterium]